MTTELAEMAAEHGPIIKIWLSDISGGKPIPTAVQNWYGSGGFEGYQGNVGLVRVLAGGL